MKAVFFMGFLLFIIWNGQFRYKYGAAYVNNPGSYRLKRSMKIMRLENPKDTMQVYISFII
jgi:hypothetical protein